MKKIIFLFAIVSSATLGSAQVRSNVGIGYFGQIISYPGAVLEYELEQQFGETSSLPLRIDLGFYVHPRHSNGFFLDVNYGLRKTYKNGFMIEESIGAGVMATMVNGDGTFEVDDDGMVREASPWNKPDFMPSITLGMGYNFTQKKEKLNMLWVRPKLYWQLPYKTSSVFHPALQVGFTHTIR